MYDWKVEKQLNVAVTKCNDNKLAQKSYAALDPEDICERLEGKQKMRIEVLRPHCAKK